jgi:hypothetical protein
VRSDEGISGCLLGCLKQDHAKGDEAMDFGDNLSDEENDLGYGVPAGSLRARTCKHNMRQNASRAETYYCV